ncbi:MAG: hypothetical protein JWM10_4438 [Myxococcaceae bacterium]|nr:hypothetical protein [Myxococcaceae bacterium]
MATVERQCDRVLPVVPYRQWVLSLPWERRMKSPRSTGATHRVMTPMEFMARLSALVPPPRTPLVRYQGVVAPNSPWRVAVVPLPPVEEAIGVCGGGATVVAAASVAAVVAGAAVASTAPAKPTAAPSAAKAGRIDWARLLWRVWKVDGLKCPACDARMTIIAALTERTGIVRVLEHLGLSAEVPRLGRARRALRPVVTAGGGTPCAGCETVEAAVRPKGARTTCMGRWNRSGRLLPTLVGARVSHTGEFGPLARMRAGEGAALDALSTAELTLEGRGGPASSRRGLALVYRNVGASGDTV